ncbi:MAG TPA: hypothetical protein VFV38_05745, partial [Ktedonobacteraceae bacterium]|nr:hypothetical protein [Ktedonobacteraceae bacterium]
SGKPPTSLSDAMDEIGYDATIGAIGGLISALPLINIGGVLTLSGTATDVVGSYLANGLLTGTITNAASSGLSALFNWTVPSIANAAEITPQQQVEFQEEQDDQEGANYFHMSLKKYKAWSQKEAVQAAKDTDTFRRNYVSRYQSYLALVRGNSPNLTASEDARMAEWRGAYNAMMRE